MSIKHAFQSAKADEADTTLVRPSNWNAEHVTDLNKIIWKDTFGIPLDLSGKTADIAWTDLDLTAYTSANAKFAILVLWVRGQGASRAGLTILEVRKKGTTDSLALYLSTGGYVQWEWKFTQIMLALDSGQVMQYTLDVSGSDSTDCRIQVIGYIE